ncbi:hypothetical protein CJP46_23495 [Paenibacillus sp. XY044]|nr:hypothetical protein CJP46_23495 [Paenibacillus sp. XY044]
MFAWLGELWADSRCFISRLARGLVGGLRALYARLAGGSCEQTQRSGRKLISSKMAGVSRLGVLGQAMPAACG